MKINPEHLEAAPEITPMFQSAEGGLRAVLAAMRFSGQDEVLRAFLKKYDAIPVGDRERLPWEAIAMAAKIDLHHLIGSIMFAMQATSANTVRILAWSAHPEVMRKRIEFAKLPSGEADRTKLDIGLGFLPSPKGPTFIGKAVFGAAGGSRESDDSKSAPIFDGDEDLDELFPPSNAMQEKLVPIRQRLLASNTSDE